MHLPAYLADKGLPPHVGVTALALIGLFNIFGTYSAGLLGGRMPSNILSFIYFARSVVIAVLRLAAADAVEGLCLRRRAWACSGCPRCR